MKLRDNGNGEYVFYCSGCHGHHLVNTLVKNKHGSIWRFNGDMNNPTFHPSIHIWQEGINGKETICHSIITSGIIQYVNDSRHDLKGQMIELTDVE